MSFRKNHDPEDRRRSRRNAVCPGCGATDAYMSPFSGRMSCRACDGGPVDHVKRAADAINAAYDDWNRSGGVSPDSMDELIVAADALGLKLDHDEANSDPVLVAAADKGFETASNGAEIEEIARIYVDALKQTGRLTIPTRPNSDGEGPVHVREDGRTTCCGAYTTISMDDMVEYCKKCYRAVEGYLDEAVYALPTRVDLVDGVRCEACSRANKTETLHPSGYRCPRNKRRPRR